MEAGSRLGVYEILAPLGAGGMGEVYRARDPHLSRDVAIKVISSALGPTPDAVRRFEQEARALAALNHPHVAVVHGLEESGGTRFLIMELVEGESLERRLERDPLPRAEALAVAGQVANALEAAHARGIVHRDLKPSNVMIDARGHVKLLDFGLSKLVDDDGGEETRRGVTKTGTVLGTAPYMSPEQIEGKPTGRAADVWSFGCLLYELLTGARAFREPTFAATAASVVGRDPDWSRLPADVPPAIKSLLVDCLRKDPARRPGSMAHVQTVLRESRSVPRSSTRFRRALIAACVIAAAAAVALLTFKAARRAPPSADRPAVTAIAVLPLVSDSADPAQAFFVDGMTDAVINDLAQLGLWKVISRTSVMRYRHQAGDVRSIARELGVDAVIEGSVLQAGGRVRIAARLIHAASEQTLWTYSAERDLKDILALQRDVARSIATELKGHLSAETNQRLGPARQVDPETHLLYMKGRFLWNERTAASLTESVHHFERALARTPDYAPAYAGLAESYALLPAPGMSGSAPAAAFPRARDAARRAIELDPTLAGAHAALAYTALIYEWDWQAAEREFKTALHLNPNYANGHFWYGAALASRGRFKEAIDQARLAVGLDPVSPIITAGLSWMHHYARDHDAVIAVGAPVLQLNPRYAVLHNRIGVAYRHKQRYRESIEHLRSAVEASGGNSDMRAELAVSLARGGSSPEARRILTSLVERSMHEYVSSYSRALVHHALGEQEAALQWLAKAVDERAWLVPFMAVEPELDDVRKTARFQQLLKAANLPYTPGQ